MYDLTKKEITFYWVFLYLVANACLQLSSHLRFEIGVTCPWSIKSKKKLKICKYFSGGHYVYSHTQKQFKMSCC